MTPSGSVLISQIPGHKHGKLKGHSIFEGTEIKSKPFLYLFKTIHKRIPMHIQLSGCLRQIQIILKESTDDRQCLSVDGIQ